MKSIKAAITAILATIAIFWVGIAWLYDHAKQTKRPDE
jgi:hypothetical protein